MDVRHRHRPRTGSGLSFSDDTLGVGTHAITAEVSLPNGDRLSYTNGGILVQSIYAGTYAGLFDSTVTYDTYSLGCAGAATLVVGARVRRGRHRRRVLPDRPHGLFHEP